MGRSQRTHIPPLPPPPPHTRFLVGRANGLDPEIYTITHEATSSATATRAPRPVPTAAAASPRPHCGWRNYSDSVMDHVDKTSGGFVRHGTRLRDHRSRRQLIGKRCDVTPPPRRDSGYFCPMVIRAAWFVAAFLIFRRPTTVVCRTVSHRPSCFALPPSCPTRPRCSHIFDV